MNDSNTEKPLVKPKQKITNKQKDARLMNLELGRKKRMENIKQRKEAEKNKPEEYDLSSNSESESDDGFVISKKKPAKKVAFTTPPNVALKPRVDDNLRSEMNELKNIVLELANIQKKQNKKKDKQSNKGTKIVVLPPSTSGGGTTSLGSEMERLKKSLGM